ncbi:MAG: CapA family protein [Spirochaetes bacterium]|nr:CapA family protein [Spirochaetota bacterium]MBN2769529.1 CapA family protein [Spirochaetota bacterium]
MKVLKSIVSVSLLCLMILWQTSGVAFFGKKEATVGFAGDIMMHIRVKKCAAINGFDHLFKRISPELESVDYMSGNMEFPVSPPFKSKGIIFNAPEASIPAVKKAGFDLVVLANNHILDQKEKGLLDTIAFLEKYNLPFIGVKKTEKDARLGHVETINGIRVGMTAYAGLINYPDRNRGSNFYVNWIYKKRNVLEDIKEMKKRCDFLVMQVHTGVEYVLEPRQSDRELFQEYLDAGVDLIIGHHPHMLQSMETYKTKDGRTTEIFYSLGNFVHDQTRSVAIRKTRKSISIKSSAIVKLHLTRVGSSIVDRYTVVPIHTVHEFLESGGQKYKNIQTATLKDLVKESEGNTGLSKYYKNETEAVRLTLFKGKIPSNIAFIE